MVATGTAVISAKHNSIFKTATAGFPQSFTVSKGSIIVNANLPAPPLGGGFTFGIVGDQTTRSNGGGFQGLFSWYVNISLQAGPPTYLEELHKLDNQSSVHYKPRL